ncbi:outer membrane protein assembly factor BamE [Sulfurisoma sediminicola]|uniref:Outer membrane protein assembly factor BamE n=1 Tax=Sulfurisoma sediminicola TaxID=1381557 RepID=A0A497XB48_9PROT|nr:outer membrane protein assembly factor BamE [Sulfurisoma sediminicola]RLJ63540.1 Beta-barrel assembly machine subunit BamE [Sulfurisoma sediminicola]
MIRVLAILLPLLLAACSSVSTPQPYRIDIQQGNVITQEMVAQLKPGLTKDQVRFILGSPLVADMFHTDRWDYVYMLQPGKGEVQRRRLTVIFEDNKLARLAGDVVAGDGWLEGPQAVPPPSRVIEIPPADKK